MRFGPFGILKLEKLKARLEEQKVRFTFYIDKDLEAKAKRDGSGSGWSPSELRTVFFDIEDEDLGKVQNVIPEFTQVTPSDGAYELGEDD